MTPWLDDGDVRLSTLREHLEAIRDMAARGESWSTNYLPHAEAALEILKTSEHAVLSTRHYALVPDPERTA